MWTIKSKRYIYLCEIWCVHVDKKRWCFQRVQLINNLWCGVWFMRCVHRHTRLYRLISFIGSFFLLLRLQHRRIVDNNTAHRADIYEMHKSFEYTNECVRCRMRCRVFTVCTHIMCSFSDTIDLTWRSCAQSSIIFCLRVRPPSARFQCKYGVKTSIHSRAPIRL